MAYDADHMSAWDKTKPDGSNEKVPVVDNAIREAKRCLENDFGAEHNLDDGSHKAGALSVIHIGTKASFPAAAAGHDGALACATDEDYLLYYDNGGTWTATDLRLIGRGYTALSADTTLDDTHDFVTITAAAANRTITFPAAKDGWIYTIMRIDASENTVTLSPNGAETFNGAASVTLNCTYEYVTYIGVAGTGWLLIGSSHQAGNVPVGRGGFKNLVIQTVADDQNVDVDADSIVLEDGNGNYMEIFDLDVTIDFTTVGAINGLDAGTLALNTAYFLYAAAKRDGSKGALASTSSTWAGVTKPTDYVFGRFIGWCVSDATADPFNIEEFYQKDDTCYFEARQEVIDDGAAAVLTAVDLSSGGLSTHDTVPVVGCKEVIGQVNRTSGTMNGVGIGFHSGANSITIYGSIGSYGQFDIILKTAQTIWYEVFDVGTYDIFIIGFRLQI